MPLFAMIEAEMSCVMETVFNENQHIVKDTLDILTDQYVSSINFAIGFCSMFYTFSLV